MKQLCRRSRGGMGLLETDWLDSGGIDGMCSLSKHGVL